MRLVHHSKTALAFAGALALAGTAATTLPDPAAAAPPGTSVRAPVAAAAPPSASAGATPSAAVPGGEDPDGAVPVLAPVTLTGTADGYELGLGPERTLDLDDGHRVTGADGVTRWETAAAWDTAGAGAPGTPVRWALTAAEGPGAVRVLEPEDGGADPLVRFDSADGLPDGYDLPAGRRGETRWTFDAPGTYRLTFTARTAAGTRPATAEVRHTVRVGGGAAEPGEATAPTAPSALAARPLPGPRAPRAVTTAAPAEAVETVRKVLDEGHVDIAARLVDGRLQIHVKDGTVPGRTVWREPSSVVLRVKPQARKTIPAHKDFAFLGRAGDPVWLLDQVQQPGLLWPGWSTDNLPAGATRGDVEFRLVKAEGPGRFALYNYDGLSGATVRFNSADGVPDAFRVPQNAHAHGGWAFGEEGDYRLTVSMSGFRADGARVSDTETLTFAVGEGAGAGPGGGTGSTTAGSTGGGTGGTGGAGGTGGTGGPGGTATGGAASGGSSAVGGPAPRGSMASTGAASTALLGGTAVALAAAGAAAVRIARRRSA